MLEMGDIMGTFVGHDHGNDFWGRCMASVFVMVVRPAMLIWTNHFNLEQG